MTKVKKYLVPVMVYLSIFVAWELLGRGRTDPTSPLIAPSEILTTIWDKRVALSINTLTTLGETVAGLGLAIALGTVLALMIDRFRLLGEGIYRFALIIYSIPLIALAPALVAALGLGVWSKIAIAMLGAYFPIVVNITTALRTQDPRILELGKVLNQNYVSTLVNLRAPAVAPDFLASLKIAAPAAFIAAIIAEWIGAESGLGLAMMHAMFGYKMADLWAIVVLATAINGLIILLFGVIARVATPWHESSQRRAEV
ncbi:ABC transporter permease [Leucobacter aridicollis]|uniref:ABC-type nitrate/sulfonate/bicarbonate transport system permease component n=1 Tax=Leucobacter aridicollis TaxID=283878 RepID=A0A852R034_9MICO|nr:ABC transporter permease subunit [Leucobacter aridicollis]NYD28073.1 ABC-type nitrate/sulfonate/bicarbonate transport system permease component [Leucobacter aridicollis]